MGEEQAAKTTCKGANRPTACGKVDDKITEYGVRITERGRSRSQTDATQSRPYPRAEPARDYQRGYTPGLARSVRSPDPTRDRYKRSKRPKERLDGPWRRLWGGGRGQAAKMPCNGAKRPSACAKVQRLSQISEYGVQSTEGDRRARGHGGMGEEEPRRKRPRAESAGKPHGLGEWIFIAPKACTAPFPYSQTKPQ